MRALLPPRRRMQGCPTGFTLLETVLAMVLVSTILASIVATTGLYTQYRARSLEGNQRVRILQGTVEDFRNDLRACLPRDARVLVPTPESGQQRDDRFSLVRAEVPRLQSQSGQEEFLEVANPEQRPIHFVGRRDSLLLLRDSANTRFVEYQDAYAPVLRHVVWLAPQVNSARLPQYVSATRPVESVFRGSAEESAAQRGVFPLEANSTASATGEQRRQSLPASTWQSNEYVDFLGFRYHDGESWQTEWDSHLVGGLLPCAVELTLSLKMDPQKRHRFVIQVVSGEAANTLPTAVELSSVR